MMKKIISLFFLFLLIAGNAWAATKYPVIAGGNWGTAATWTLNSDGTTNATTVPASGDDIIFNATSGNVAINVNTAQSLKSFVMTGYKGTLSGTGLLYVGGASGTTQNCIFDGTITWTGGLRIRHAAINAHINLTTNGKSIPGIITTAWTGATSTSTTLQDNLTLTAGSTLSIANGTRFILNGFTISGADATKGRVFVIGGTFAGTTYINLDVSTAGSTFANADFRDCLFTNGGSDYNLSAITGLSGDCGGNGMSGGGTLTFTTPATQTWSYGGVDKNWSTVGNWSSGRIPLPQDDVTISGTLECILNMPRAGKSISFSGSNAFTITTPTTFYGSLNLTGSGTLTQGANAITFESQARTGTITLTSAGKSFGASVTVATVGATLQLGDDFTGTSTAFTVGTTNATFDANDHNFTITNNFVFSNGIVYMGNGTWTINAAATTVCWNVTSGAATTLYKEGANIVFDSTNTTVRTFRGGSKEYNRLTIPGTTTPAITIEGSNSFSSIVGASSGNKTIIFTAGTTQTITGDMSAGFGNGTNTLTLLSSSAGTAATLDYDYGGTISADYLNITDTNVTPASTWYYGNNSTYNSGTGWTAGTPGVSDTSKFFMLW